MPPGLLERIDRAIAELQAIRAAVAEGETGTIVPVDSAEGDIGTIVPISNGLDEADLLDTHAAAARFGFPRDTIALWARQGCGIKRGGRWLVDPAKLRRRLNGK